MEGLVKRLQPLLRASKQGARVYYQGVCAAHGGFEEMSFPEIILRTVSRGKSGIEAIREMLPNSAIVEERSGVVSIKFYKISYQILHTKINVLKLSRGAQFDEILAVQAIESNPDVQAAMRRFGYTLPIEEVSFLPSMPEPGARHLPPRLSGLTMDRAFDQVAKTFGGIVFFGVCEKQHLYAANVQGGYDWIGDRDSTE